MVVMLSQLRPARWAWCSLFVLSVAARPLPAQQTSAPSADEIYKQAKTANTIEQFDRAIQQLEALRGNGARQELREYFTKLLAWTFNRRGETYVKQAADLAAKGDAQAARQFDAKALSDFETSIRLDATRWKSLHNRGVCYALEGRFDEALTDFSRTIELRPKYADAWFNRGEIHYELGRFAEAVEDYNQAIQLRPDDAGLFTSRGHAQFQLRRFQAALDDYQKAVELDKLNAVRFVNRGDAYRALGKWKLAANDFRQAIKLDNRLSEAYQSAAWLMATCPEQQYRNAKLAVQAAQKAVQLAGAEDYIYLDTLAAAQANNQQFSAAEKTIRQAIHLAPADNVEPLKKRLGLYRAKQPYRQVSYRSK